MRRYRPLIFCNLHPHTLSYAESRAFLVLLLWKYINISMTFTRWQMRSIRNKIINKPKETNFFKMCISERSKREKNLV